MNVPINQGSMANGGNGGALAIDDAANEAEIHLQSVQQSLLLAQRQESRRRLQIGGAGLGGVILLIGLASIITTRRDAAPNAPTNGPVATTDATVSGPLAELGVQPTDSTVGTTAPGQAAGPLQTPAPATKDMNGQTVVPDLEPSKTTPTQQ